MTDIVLIEHDKNYWASDDSRWVIQKLHKKTGDVFRISDMHRSRSWETPTFDDACAVLTKQARSARVKMGHPGRR